MTAQLHELEAMRADRDRWRALVCLYGVHAPGCKIWRPSRLGSWQSATGSADWKRGRCDCGLLDALGQCHWCARKVNASGECQDVNCESNRS